MSLSIGEIAALLEEMDGLQGARVRRVRGLDPHTIVLLLRSSDRRKAYLLLSTRPRLSRFHLIEGLGERRPGGVPRGVPFADAARAHLEGTTLRSFRQVSGDRVVELSFAARRDAGRGSRREAGVSPQARTRAEVRLVLEIRGGRGQLALVDDGRRILATLHPLRRSGADLGPGDLYRFPLPRPASPLIKAAAPSPWRHLRASEIGGGGAARPLHRAVAERYAGLEAAQDLADRKSALLVRLRREEARLSALAEKVRADLEEARTGEDHKRKGELLKGAYGTLRRGLASIELEDYFDPAGGKVVVELDPSLGPRENIERYFRRYRKCARAVPLLAERLDRIEAELRRTARAGRSVEGCERPADLDALEAGLGPSGKGPSGKGPSGKGSPTTSPLRSPLGRSSSPRPRERRGAPAAPAGPRRFVSSDGFEILVGRNARGNDELTTRIGRGNDTFLHVSGRPGSHVLIRNVPGKTVPLSTLVEAAELAVYYSLPQRSRGAAAAGMKAEVDVAPLKNVRKPRGGKPGQVLLATRKTLRVRLDAAAIARLRGPSEGPGSTGGDP